MSARAHAVGALAAAMFILGMAFLASGAQAAVRSVTIDVTPDSPTPTPTPTPTLGAPTSTPSPYSEVFSYDDVRGIVTVAEGGRDELAPDPPAAPNGGPTWPGFGQISFQHCPGTTGPPSPDLSLSTDDEPFYQDSGQFTLTSSSGQLQLGGAASVSPDGATLAITWSSQSNLAHLNLTCVVVDGLQFNFDGYGLESASVANASDAFDGVVLTSADVVIPTPEGNDCPLRVGSGTFNCATEYSIGERWFSVTGYVAWVGGAPTPHVTLRTSWVRGWHGDSTACLARFRVHGTVASNMPCGVAADAIAHQSRGVGHRSGTGTATWTWLSRFPCQTRRGLTTCTNAVGDAYRYTSRPVVR
jgi:hypothetical protein